MTEYSNDLRKIEQDEQTVKNWQRDLKISGIDHELRRLINRFCPTRTRYIIYSRLPEHSRGKTFVKIGLDLKISPQRVAKIFYKELKRINNIYKYRNRR